MEVPCLAMGKKGIAFAMLLLRARAAALPIHYTPLVERSAAAARWQKWTQVHLARVFHSFSITMLAYESRSRSGGEDCAFSPREALLNAAEASFLVAEQIRRSAE